VQAPTNRAPEAPQVFWLWAPLHFDEFCTHLALHEFRDGRRWLETVLQVPAGPGAAGGGEGSEPEEWSDLSYSIEWEPGRRELRQAEFSALDQKGAKRVIQVEKLYTFRMRGIGYFHPTWGHGMSHGELEVGREDIALDSFDPLDFTCIHLQNIVKATFEGRTGVGVVEQIVIGEHEPTGMTGFLDGWRPN
jgi:hypothetical protein